MAKKDSEKGGGGLIDDVQTTDGGVIVEKLTRAKDSSEARRRVEVALENKALKRLINDDFYEQG